MSFSILERLMQNLRTQPGRNAFFIAGKYYTYGEFCKYIAAIQRKICAMVPEEEEYIGIGCFDDIETYAAIYATWFSGKAFVPVNPLNPSLRNEAIIKQVGLKFILHSQQFPEDSAPKLEGLNFIATAGLKLTTQPIRQKTVKDDADIYILFTSGSTGIPKGVRISRSNLNSYVNSFLQNGYVLNSQDRFLQIYDLSFDASIRNLTIALMAGGCLYTVPQKVIKYLYAYELIRDHELTFISMPPTTLAYLKPFFNSIRLEKVRYSLFGGEPFPEMLALEWQKCVPNAVIQNVYGPTELTVNCLVYNWIAMDSLRKSYNGIVSIGKVFGENKMLITEPDGVRPVNKGEKGELCVGGPQVSPGYWGDTEKNTLAFFEFEGDRYYRTGDLVFEDKNGDVMFCGRIDNQVQIQGFRVEPGEIEKHARDFLEGANVAAVAVENDKKILEIYLFVENCTGKEDLLLTYMSHSLPSYMLPRRIINVEFLPKTSGGKIDRKQLKNMVSS